MLIHLSFNGISQYSNSWSLGRLCHGTEYQWVSSCSSLFFTLTSLAPPLNCSPLEEDFPCSQFHPRLLRPQVRPYALCCGVWTVGGHFSPTAALPRLLCAYIHTVLQSNIPDPPEHCWWGSPPQKALGI